MATRIRVLDAGRLLDTGRAQLNLTQGNAYELYRVPAAKTAIVKSFRLVNAHTKAIAVTVTLGRLGCADQAVFPSAMQVPAGFMVAEDREFTMASDDVIRIRVGNVDPGDTSTTLIQKIHYVISGADRDV
jgi:hypothetical protein